MSVHPVLPGDKHLCATVFLMTDETVPRFLLLHHKKLGAWLPPGGHAERNENPVETAIRETKEETGIDVSALLSGPSVLDRHAAHLLLPRYLLEETIPAHGDQPEHFHIDHVYVATVPYQSASFDLNESHDAKWVTVEEIAELETFDNIRILVKEISP